MYNENLIGKYVELVSETLKNYEAIMGKEKCLGGVFGYVFEEYNDSKTFKIDVNGITVISEREGFKVVSTLIDDEISNVIYDMLNLQVPVMKKTDKDEFNKTKRPIKISKKTEKLVKEIELWHIENAIDKSLEVRDYLAIPKLIESRRLLEQR